MTSMIRALSRLAIALVAIRIAANGFLLWMVTGLQQSTERTLDIAGSSSVSDRVELAMYAFQRDAVMQILGATGAVILIGLLLLHAAARKFAAWVSLILGVALLVEAALAPQYWLATAYSNLFAAGAFESVFPATRDTSSLFFVAVQSIGFIVACLIIWFSMKQVRSPRSTATAGTA